MNKTQYFGTDGIRGLVGQTPMTPSFMLSLGQTIAQILSNNGRCYVVIGRDTRQSCHMLQSALQAGLCAGGAHCIDVGIVPTPAVAFLVKQLDYDVGVMISASHNPSDDNGIKIFSSNGQKLTPEMERQISDHINSASWKIRKNNLGNITGLPTAISTYQDFCLSQFTPQPGKTLTGRCVVDCAHGACYQIAPQLLRSIGLSVIPMGTAPNGSNINHACGSTAITGLRKNVVAHRADFGIAFDGDGDRVIFVDHTGDVVDGDQLLFIIARAQHLQKNGLGVVGTVMSNHGLAQALAHLGIPFARAAVGDRSVLATCHARGWPLGGETSGHIVSLNHTTTGDGLVSAMLVLSEMANTGLALRTLTQDMKKYPQVLLNIPMAPSMNPLEHPSVVAAVRDTEGELADQGRVVIRMSGTEPVLRIMVEGGDAHRVSQMAHALAETVNQNLCLN